jgi:hypothetical protein
MVNRTTARVCRASPRRRRPEQDPAAQIGAVAAAEHLLDQGLTPLFDAPTLQALWAAGHWRLVERLSALTALEAV